MLKAAVARLVTDRAWGGGDELLEVEVKDEEASTAVAHEHGEDGEDTGKLCRVSHGDLLIRSWVRAQEEGGAGAGEKTGEGQGERKGNPNYLRRGEGRGKENRIHRETRESRESARCNTLRQALMNINLIYSACGFVSNAVACSRGP